MCDRQPTPRTKWLAELRKAGKRPLIELIEEVTGKQWGERERYWIKWYRENGHDLLNATDGGEGTSGHIQPIREKIPPLKFNCGYCGCEVLIPRWRLKQNRCGVFFCDRNHRAKGLGLGKKPLSPQAIESMRQKLTGRKRNPEVTARIQATKASRPRTDAENKGARLMAQRMAEIKAQRQVFRCAKCGTEVSRHASLCRRNKKHYCSKDCWSTRSQK
jgi:predicted RNA-binding Zn-ribbon protein involved in translation (DUF1610 family)